MIENLNYILPCKKVRHHAAHDMLCPIRFLIALTPPSKLLAKTQRGTNFYKVVLFLYYFSAPNISRNIFPQFQNEVNPNNFRKNLKGLWRIGGIQWLRGHNFALFWPPPTSPWTLLSLSVDKNRDFLDHLPPLLVHVVIECPRSGKKLSTFEFWLEMKTKCKGKTLLVKPNKSSSS